MYLPKHFDSKDEKRILEIIDAYSFATIMSFDQAGEPFFSHVPLVTKKTASGFSLLGHVAKRNPQWSHLKNNPKIKVIINGPHTYITPKWYRSGRDVPTWNYVAKTEVMLPTQLSEIQKSIYTALKIINSPT